MKTYESYRAEPMSANASFKVGGARIAGFLCVASGTITVTDADGTVLLNALPVTAGAQVSLPMFFKTTQGGTVTLGTNAAGTLLV